MTTVFDSVDETINAVRNGDLVVVVDDDDRENEGDLIMAASKATPEKVAFMVRHTSGILCTPLTEEQATRLNLDPMVSKNNAPMSTAFTVSVDYEEGLSTGISAEERANTVQALANSNAQSSDFVRPGHIFPLVSKKGGVLVRSGHTEAAVDLAQAAGCPPVGLLSEIVNDDGSVKRGAELMKFAEEHDLKIISIADVIAWRQRRERLVTRIREFSVRTRIGPALAYAYKTTFETAEHLVLVFGDLRFKQPVPVRIHRERLVEDVFGPQDQHPSRLVDVSLDRIKELGGGVFIYLLGGFVGVPMAQLHEVSDSRETERAKEWLEIGVGAQIILDLGISDIQIIAGREIDYVGLKGFGINVESVSIL